MGISRRGFVGLAGCCVGLVAATVGCASDGQSETIDSRIGLSGADEESRTMEACYEAFFDQIVADRNDIKLYSWQDARSGSYGYGGAEFPRGSFYPHSIYIEDLDGDGIPELLYLCAHQDHGVMLGCRLKLFKYDEDARDCHMVFSSPTFPDPLPSCSWQPKDDSGGSLWERPEVCWDRLDPDTDIETTDFILFTVAEQEGLYGLISSVSQDGTERYLVHMAYDADLDTLVTVEDPWVRRNVRDDGVLCWRGANPVGEDEYQQAEDLALQGVDIIITFNGSGNGFSAILEPKLKGKGRLTELSSARGRQAVSFGVALALLGGKTGKRAAFVEGGDVEVFRYGMNDLVQNRSPLDHQPKLAHVLMALACAAYDKEDVIDSLVGLGCTRDLRTYNYYEDPYDSAYGPDQVGFAIGLSQMDDGSSLVIVVLRGSYPDFELLDQPTPADWKSNFNLGVALNREGEHTGFSKAADEVLDCLNRDFRDMHELTGDNATLVICGHSRGGAVGNLLAKRLLDSWANAERLFCYNFSCPDTARYGDVDWTRDGLYNGIFNISDVWDLISWMPGILGDLIGFGAGLVTSFNGGEAFASWGKFGQSYWFENEDGGTNINLFGGHSYMTCLDFFSSLPKEGDLMSGGEGMLFWAKFNLILELVSPGPAIVSSLIELIH